MEFTCKWATIGIFLVVFMALIALSNCLHVAEFFGSAFVGFVIARSFFFGICKKNVDRLAQHN